MNLGRAKSILIIAFISLNIFLGYHLFGPDFGRLTRVAVTAEEMRVTEIMLNENNYILEASLDRAIQTSDFLTVSPALNFRETIMDRFTEENALISILENATIYSHPDETAVFHQGGLIQIIFEPGVFFAAGAIYLEQRELRNKVETFLKEKRLMPEDIMFDFLEKVEPEQVILYYYQVYDNMPVYSGQLQVVIDRDHIVEVRIYWLEPLERSPAREMEVMSATEALTNLIKELGPGREPQKIKRVDLGFFSGEYDAEKWEIPPVWRVVIDWQQFYYINAFTGNLEQEIIIPEQLP